MPRTNHGDDVVYGAGSTVDDAGTHQPNGISKREYAAVAIMAALAGNKGYEGIEGEDRGPSKMAFIAVACADALFDELRVD